MTIGKHDENQILSNASLITGIGDWLSYFAQIVVVYKLTGSAILAAYTVPLKSLAVGVGAFSFLRLSRQMSLRTVILVSQLASVLVAGKLAYIVYEGTFVSPWVILGGAFLSSLLKQWFDIARETYSKTLAKKAGEKDEHRSTQAQLLQGIFGAQFIGPLLALVMIKICPIWVPFVADSFSFLVAGIMCGGLKHSYVAKEVKASLFKPFSYLSKTPGLLEIFLIRSVGFWVGCSIFNYLLFSVVMETYGFKPEDAAYIYSMTGLGSLIGAVGLRKGSWPFFRWLHGLPDTYVAAIGLASAGLIRIGFLNAGSFGVAVALMCFSGLSGGLNAVATQSMRRKLTTAGQFPEVVALELVVAKIVDWGCATLVGIVVAQKLIGFEGMTYLGVGIYLGLALVMVFLKVLRPPG